MRTHLIAAAVWLAVVVAGYLFAERFTAPPAVARSVGNGRHEIIVPVARDGHYYIDGAVNGLSLRFLVDTGASYVSVGADFARRANLPKGVAGHFDTANGAVEGRVVKGLRVSADVLEVSGLSVAVLPGANVQGLLGQNFLRHFEVSQGAGTLTLTLRK